jgi:hypothetical protein
LADKRIATIFWWAVLAALPLPALLLRLVLGVRYVLDRMAAFTGAGFLLSLMGTLELPCGWSKFSSAVELKCERPHIRTMLIARDPIKSVSNAARPNQNAIP